MFNRKKPSQYWKGIKVKDVLPVWFVVYYTDSVVCGISDTISNGLIAA